MTVRDHPLRDHPTRRATSPDDAATVVAGAHRAFADWRRTDPGDRAACLRAAAAEIRATARELGAVLTATTGKLLRDSVSSAEVAADLLEEASVVGLGARGRTLAGGYGSVDWTRREPHGVVAVLTPWNDPFPAAAGLISAALVTGNTVVHKPSERSQDAGLWLAEVIANHLPDGVLGVVSGDATLGEQLVRDARVPVVAHIGSSASGAAIAEVCGARGAKAILENGGKDALLVDSGIDPVWAAGQAATGAFTNAGQLCTSVERIYVHRSVAEPFLEELVRLAESHRRGDPAAETTTMCRLIDARQLDTVRAHVTDALVLGARCVAGGLGRLGEAADVTDEHLWFPPTVLVDCTHDMLVLREETFGPVAPVVVVDSWEQAVEQADFGDYGLAATVLTADSAHALQAIEALEVGTVKVNAVFGGAPGGSADPRRSSGQGRGYGPELLDELTLTKAVHWEPPPAP